jgi:hypothetical protein
LAWVFIQYAKVLTGEGIDHTPLILPAGEMLATHLFIAKNKRLGL